MKITIENFKNIKFIHQEFGKFTTVSGKNKTGKTTVLSAIVWCLTGVDLYGIDNPKPQGIERPEQTTVAITFANGTSFGRMLAEKWTKNRQTLEYEYQGNETTYMVNGEKVKKADFEKAVSGGGAFLLKGLTLRESLLSMMLPGYFPADLDEKKCRAVIMDLANISNADKLEIAKELDFDGWDMPNISEKLKADAKTAEKNVEAKAAVKKDIETQLNDYGDLPDADKLNAEIEELRAKERELITADGREAKKAKILAEMKAAEADYNAKKQLWDANERKQEIEVKTENQRKINGWMAECAKISEEYNKKLAEYNANREKIVQLEKIRDAACDAADSYAKRYREIEKQHFEGDICPVTKKQCQTLVEMPDIEEARKKFNLEKARMLEECRADGIENDEKAAKLMDEIKALDNMEKPEQPELPVAPEEVKYTPKPFPVINDKLEELKKQLEAVESQADSEELAKIKLDIEAKEGMKGLIAIKNNLVKRFEDICMELVELKKQYQSKFTQLQLSQEYALRLSQLAETRAKSAIGYKVKLNEPTLAGDLRPVCVFADAKGVNFNSINTAARINNGIAICDRLAEHCDHIFPILVDNAEAVNKLNTDTKSEMVVAKVSDDAEIKFN